jgi:hypothetical protein
MDFNTGFGLLMYMTLTINHRSFSYIAIRKIEWESKIRFWSIEV